MFHTLKRDLHRSLFVESANRNMLRAAYLFVREPSAWMTVIIRLGNQLYYGPKWMKLIFFPLYLLFLWVPFRVITGIEIYPRTRIGPGLCLKHWGGIIINYASEIGSDVTIFNDVTLGADFDSPHAPRIGNRVIIGVGAKLIGDITIGDDAIIGAGSIVVKDVPPKVIVAGNPARIIREIK